MILPADHSAPRLASRRVLFLNANETLRPYRVAPPGLAFVSSATRAAGHDVRFVDLPETASQHRAFRRLLSEWPADYLAVGIRNLDNSDFHGFESYLRQPAALVAEARRARPGIRVILGGPAATVDPQLVLRTVQPDHVVLGEDEESLPHAIARLEAGERLPAIIGADEESRSPYRVLNTGALPAPRLYEWVTNLRPYLRGDAGFPLQTKRGCPLKCTYCTYGRIEGTRYRFLDPEAIADEVEGAMARGVRDFEFVDSTFNLPPRHALGVLAALRERRLHANYVGTGLNPAKLPDELLAAMREVGFRSVILTAESASDTMLASYKKNDRRGERHTAADLLAKHDIKALWVFLLGGPGETPATVGESLGFIEERVRSPHAVYITSGIRIYAGSPIADDADSGLFVKEDLRQRTELPGLEFFYSHAHPRLAGTAPAEIPAAAAPRYAFVRRPQHRDPGRDAGHELPALPQALLAIHSRAQPLPPSLYPRCPVMKFRLLFLVLLLPFPSFADEVWKGVSTVYFKGYSNLHDFEGSVDKVPLKVTVIPGKDGRVVSAVTEVPVKQMSTKHEERDQNMMEMFQETVFRQIKVEVNRVPEAELRPKGAKPRALPVALTIAGTRSVVNGSVSGLTESAGSAAFDLKFQVSLKAFKLKAPGALVGLVRVKDTVDVVAHITLKKEGTP